MFGLRLIRITGQSMEPRLPARSFALFRRAREYKAGDIVLADHARYGAIVKQISDIQENGVHLRGLAAAESVSSEQMGLVPLKRLRGKLIWASVPKV